jgi:hypothetical protein
MSYIILRGHWCDTIVLNVHAPTKNKIGMLCRMAVVSTDISEEIRESIIRMTRISKLETTLFQQPHGVTSKKTAFFIDTTMKTSNLTKDKTDRVKDSFYEELECVQ